MSGAVVVLGGDARGFALAGELALAGHEVVLYERQAHEDRVAPVMETRHITVVRDDGAETASLALVTTDPFKAFVAGDVLLATVPSAEHREFGELLLPLVEPRHVLLLMPGGLGALHYAHWLLARGRWITSLATFAETDLEPFVCHKAGPDAVRVHGRPAKLGVGVFPAQRTAATVAQLEGILGPLHAYPHAAAAGLAAVEALLRSVTILLNAGRIERSHGGFPLYEEGFTPHVAAVAQAIDGERRAVAAALGCELPSAARTLCESGLGPVGDLWSTVHGSRALSRVKAPRSLRSRWLDGGVSQVLRAWAELGELLAVAMPATRALVVLADAVSGTDSWSVGRSLDDLGLSRLRGEALSRYLETGEAD